MCVYSRQMKPAAKRNGSHTSIVWMRKTKEIARYCSLWFVSCVLDLIQCSIGFSRFGPCSNTLFQSHTAQSGRSFSRLCPCPPTKLITQPAHTKNLIKSSFQRCICLLNFFSSFICRSIRSADACRISFRKLLAFCDATTIPSLDNWKKNEKLLRNFAIDAFELKTNVYIKYFARRAHQTPFRSKLIISQFCAQL